MANASHCRVRDFGERGTVGTSDVVTICLCLADFVEISVSWARFSPNLEVCVRGGGGAKWGSFPWRMVRIILCE